MCIIGGGPAGSFAALQLLHLGHLNHLPLEVMIFEPRDFSRPGPSGCNRCAGVLSSRLWGNLAELDLYLPQEIIQAELKHYSIHLDGEVIHLDQPDPDRRIVSVYRGGGPRMHEGPPVAGFDQFLLQQSVARGAVHIQERVRKVGWEGCPIVQSRSGSYPADLLILAVGINSKSPLEAGFGYRPPKTEIMAQDEVLRPDGWNSDEVNAYFKYPRGLNFGAIIPKGRYLNISLLGKNFTRDTVDEFITSQDLAGILQYNPSSSLCGCNPRIAVSAARQYYGDRWVAVGDAAVTRLYKDGIGSAFQTAKHAMMTTVNVGISRRAFRRHYAPVCRSIDRDNSYGVLLYRLWSFVLNSPMVLTAWKAAIQREMVLPTRERRHMQVLWGMLTGDDSYRRLFMHGISLVALLHIVHGFKPKQGGG